MLDHGIDGLIVNMLANGHLPGKVAQAAKVLAPLVGKA